jgi:cobalt transporter subunit CbtA
MLQRLLLTGLLSGTCAGIVLTIVHLSVVQPFIVEAEAFEQSSSASQLIRGHVHKNGLSHKHVGGNIPHLHEKDFHMHAKGFAHVHPNIKESHIFEDQIKVIKHDHGAHIDSREIWSPQDGMERSLYSLAANILTSIAFGLLLVSGFTIYGGLISLHHGFLWGFAGFACFSFLPGLGLPPELPASAAGDLLARQMWWLGTAVSSVIGLSLLVFVTSNGWRLAGLVLMIIPHAIGAPVPEAGTIGASPPELAAHFVMVALFASVVMWTVLGVVAAFLFDRSLTGDLTGYKRVQTN